MERGINTRCLHLEETEGKTDNYGALSYPIYQTATYAHAGVGKSTGYDYSRLQNPTREQLEKVVASLEGGRGTHRRPRAPRRPPAARTGRQGWQWQGQ